MDDVNLIQTQVRERFNINDIVPASHWLELGYSHHYAYAMLALQVALFGAIVQLSLLKSPIKDNETTISNEIKWN